MTNSINLGELVRLAQTLLEAKSSGREFMLEDVHNITRAAYEQYPEDPVINQVAFTIERMATKAPQGATISQTELSSIYNNFVRLSSNSKFREVLGHLLLVDGSIPEPQGPDYSKLHRVDGAGSGLSTESFADQGMVKSIASVFTGSIDSSKPFDNKVACRGAEFVDAELKSIGCKAAVEIMGGNQENIVYAAHFDTRRGRVTVAIPTEVNNGRVLFPSTFVADNKLEELTSTNISSFVAKKSESGDFTTPRTADVLSAVGILMGQRTASQKEVSELSGAFGLEKPMELSTAGLFAAKEVENSRPDINTKHTVEMPVVLAHLTHDFENDVLEAASSFGLKSIQTGKEMIALELRAAGFKNAQVKFGSESANSVVYLATINTPKGPAQIEVPVEMQAIAQDKYIPLAPAYFAYDGLIEDFTASKLQRFSISIPAPSVKNTVCSSSYSYMLLPELKAEILKSASENDYTTCEAALAEVQKRFTEEDFKNTVADYHFILTNKTKMASQEQRQCSRMIAAGKGSIYPRCSHLGVPMHQVVVDEQGNCRLKSSIERERLNPESEGGACMSTSKINLT